MSTRPDTLLPYATLCLAGVRVGAAAGLAAVVGAELVAAVLGDVGVVARVMLLVRRALDGGALVLPHLGDVEDGVRPPLALLGLVRLEKVQLRRAEGLLAGIVPPGLEIGRAHV